MNSLIRIYKLHIWNIKSNIRKYTFAFASKWQMTSKLYINFHYLMCGHSLPAIRQNLPTMDLPMPSVR